MDDGLSLPLSRAPTGLFVLLLAATAAGAADFIYMPGQWSSRSVYLWPGPTAIADYPPNGRKAVLVAPDKKFEICVEDNQFWLRRLDGSGSSDPFPIEDLAEVQWAPDSTAFAITASGGGWVGSWSVVVYVLTQNGLIKKDVNLVISSRFLLQSRGCSEAPNVVAAGWTHSGTLLTAAFLSPHSNCRDVGTIRGYEISVHDEHVARSYSYGMLRRRYRSLLGPRLLDP